MSEHEQSGGWTYIPTMHAPNGAVEVQLSEETRQVLLVGHDNKTVAAFAADLTFEQARWLADGLNRAVAIGEMLRSRER